MFTRPGKQDEVAERLLQLCVWSECFPYVSQKQQTASLFVPKPDVNEAQKQSFFFPPKTISTEQY